MHERARVEARNEGGTWSFSPHVLFDGLRRKRDCSLPKIGPNRNCGRTAEVIFPSYAKLQLAHVSVAVKKKCGEMDE